MLQVGKRAVDITELEPVGMYAVRPTFSDGQPGIYSWDYLHKLCSEQENLWRDHLARLERAGAHRDEAAGNTDFADGTTHFGYQTVPEHEKQRRCATCSIPSPANTTS